MASYTYGGPEPQIYPQYLDAATGATLVAEPGQTYDVVQVADTVAAPGGGREPLVLAMPPDDRWTVVKPAPAKSSKENG